MQAPYSRTLADLIFEQAERYGERPAAIWRDQVISYAELCRRAACVATSLRELGTRRGEPVGLLISNRPEWLEAFFGTVIAGGVVVAFSTWSTPDELDWLMQDSAVRVLIALDRFGANDFAAALRRLVPSSRYSSLHDVVILGENQAAEFIPYETLRSGPPMQRQAPGVATCAADDAIIIYTSGSSSRPKSVPLSHGGIIENGFNIGERQGYQPRDRVLLTPPLFWSLW
jgi:fatty-acyl-CoA synthase